MPPPVTLPRTLIAGTPENINDVQDNFTAIQTEFNASWPQCRVTNTAAQSIPNNTGTAITFDTEQIDQGTASSNMHDIVTNTSRIVCRVAGLYTISATLPFVVNGTGLRLAYIRLNGTTSTPGTQVIQPPNAGFLTTIALSTIYRLAISDYIELMGFQSSGGALNTSIDTGTGDGRPMLSAAMLSP